MENEFLSAKGKRELGVLITQLRERLGITNWTEFAETLSSRAGYLIGHDQLWKVAQGYIRRAPSMELVYALTLFDEFQAPDGTHLTVEVVAKILAGELSVLSTDAAHHQPD